MERPGHNSGSDPIAIVLASLPAFGALVNMAPMISINPDQSMDRGVLLEGIALDYTGQWPKWTAVLYTSLLFALNHAAFGINFQVNSGYEVVISTLLMDTIWALVYIKTKSIRWAILSHFLVDFLGMSSAAFLDMFEKGG